MLHAAWKSAAMIFKIKHKKERNTDNITHTHTDMRAHYNMQINGKEADICLTAWRHQSSGGHPVLDLRPGHVVVYQYVFLYNIRFFKNCVCCRHLQPYNDDRTVCIVGYSMFNQCIYIVTHVIHICTRTPGHAHTRTHTRAHRAGAAEIKAKIKLKNM